FAIVALPCSSLASSSTIGSCILQGPHHGAQKSTRETPFAMVSLKISFVTTTAIIPLSLSQLKWIKACMMIGYSVVPDASCLHLLLGSHPRKHLTDRNAFEVHLQLPIRPAKHGAHHFAHVGTDDAIHFRVATAPAWRERSGCHGAINVGERDTV